MIITRSGLTIRMAVSDIRVAGRATQGVRLINIKEGDSIAAVSVVAKNEEEETEAPVEQPLQEAPDVADVQQDGQINDNQQEN